MVQIVQTGQNKKYIEQAFFYLYRANQIFPFVLKQEEETNLHAGIGS
jgi:hypothetical protein